MQVGDSVLIEDGKTPGIIVEIIESDSEQKNYGMEEPGVVMESPPFGLVFWPVSVFANDPIIFLRRA